MDAGQSDWAICAAHGPLRRTIIRAAELVALLMAAMVSVRSIALLGGLTPHIHAGLLGIGASSVSLAVFLLFFLGLFGFIRHRLKFHK
jgi:hypothetical protein